MGPPATKKKAQLQTPPIFQRRTADTARPPSLSPRIEQTEDPEPQACGSDTHAALQAVQLLFKTELSAAVAEFAKQLRDLGYRVDTLEQHSDANSMSLQDDQVQLNLHLLTLQNKVEDLENRSRRGNLRLRAGSDWTWRGPPERMHRALGRPRNNLPRDFVMKLHHVEVRDMALQAARRLPRESLQHGMQLFADLAPTTLLKRKQMQPVTAILLKQKIKYKWGFPFSLMFPWEGKQCTIRTLEEGLSLLEGTRTPTSHLSHSPSASSRQGPYWTQTPKTKQQRDLSPQTQWHTRPRPESVPPAT
ncbi:hypothetical protein XELAEV_18023428mg [Xenopus laevis]|uniref:Uncharacterized protein n=1 Tax=Xenopus laevis TaxID=8355 RepID=A0A974HP33_XENLA|nr:hypothetical protein XELAEV_18023428mg [Xenopus laevis]